MPKCSSRVPAILLFMAFSSWATAQGTIWHFGDGAGLDFNSGAAVTIGGGASFSLDNSTAATDTLGNLLFYSNGLSVWDANHDVMPNGSGLLGSNNSGQCALAVHRPGTSEFYLFTVDQWNGANGLRYSVVDMTLNGGLGDVTIKNQLLHTPGTERLEAVRNPNGSWWLISHDWNDAQFRVYNISNSGLNASPVLTTVGAIHSGYNYDAAGQLTASPNGALLACGIYDQNAFQVFDFDNTTGIVSNARDLPGYTNAWGCAFSPDNTKLYLSKWYDNEVIQVDLSAGTWADVQASSLLVGNTTGNVNGWQAGYLQLAPDGLVYVAKFGESSIGRIAFPDQPGIACGFVDVGVSLGGGICNAGLCRTAMPDGASCAISVTLPPVGGCAWTPLDIAAQVSGSPTWWSWDFGDGSTSTSPGDQEHVYFNEGLYNVSVLVNDSAGNCPDSAQVSILIGAPETAGEDSSILLCTTDAPLNLFDLLSTYADVNGIWLDALGLPAPSPFDPSVDMPGLFQYVISGVHCGPDTAWFDVDVQLCTGSAEIKDVVAFGLFPVPVIDVLWVTVPDGMRPEAMILFDALGRTVVTKGFPGEDLRLACLDLTGIGPGTYMLRIREADSRAWQRSFVKSD